MTSTVGLFSVGCSRGAGSLIERCLTADQDAWEEFVRLHHRHIFGLCYRFADSGADVPDLVQEVFVRLFQELRNFRLAEGSLKAWITRVTRNLMIDRYRRGRLDRAMRPLDDTARYIPDRSFSSSPDSALSLREANELLQDALSRLSPEVREAVILRDLQEMDYREIAHALKIPEGTVKSRLSRGRAELGRIVRKYRSVSLTATA